MNGTASHNDAAGAAPARPAATAAARRTEPVLSAVICTYNRYELLPEAIESLCRQEVAAGAIEIIVVDNSPDQVAAEAFGSRYAGIHSLTYLTEATPGLANARNVAAAAARGDVVAYIDDDARAMPGWAAALIAAYAAFAGCAGIVGGRVLPRWLGAPPPWLDRRLFGYLSLLDPGGERREVSADVALVGCNLSFSRDALAAAGGFATGLGRIGPQTSLLSNEELQLCGRIRQAGRSAVYAPDAVVEHVIHAERLTQAWFRRRAAWQAVSDLLARPEDAAALAAKAERRLGRSGAGWARLGRLRDRRTAAALQRDMVLLYDATILALSGGTDPDSPATIADRARGAVRSLLRR